MLNLDKLENKLSAALRKETKKTLNEFIKTQRAKEKKATKGKPDILYLDIPNVCFSLAEHIPDEDKRHNHLSQQRKTNGFDDTELWNLHSTIAGFIIPRLKRFAETTHGYPTFYQSMKMWEKDLNKMVRAFELAAGDEMFGKWDSPDTKEKKEENKRWKEYEEGMKLFQENFLSLWN